MIDKARLEAQMATLQARLERIEQDLAEPLNADSSEQAVEVEDDASLEAQARLLRRQIAPARLEARPEAALCIDCARQEQ